MWSATGTRQTHANTAALTLAYCSRGKKERGGGEEIESCLANGCAGGADAGCVLRPNGDNWCQLAPDPPSARVMVGAIVVMTMLALAAMMPKRLQESKMATTLPQGILDMQREV